MDLTNQDASESTQGEQTAAPVFLVLGSSYQSASTNAHVRNLTDASVRQITF
jgi:hypothetical protein